MIIRDGVVENVLFDGFPDPPQAEITDVNRDYPDAEKLDAYMAELYKRKDAGCLKKKLPDWRMTDFHDETPPAP